MIDARGNEVDSADRLRRTLERQKAAQRAQGAPDLRTRIDRLERLASLLKENERALCESLRADFGERSIQNAAMTEIAYPVSAIRYAQKHLSVWMRDERRKVAFLPSLFGARARIRYQPLGVVGVIAPWNFPVNLAVTPLTDILAAGNRAMIKPSEFTPHNSALLAELVARYFSEEEVAVFPGGLDIGAAFAALPFDHLMFTGAGTIARHVMRAAAEHLVPVTLELGGKSPVIVSRELPMGLDRAAACIVDFKLSNAGQICIAPDYLFVPEERLRDTVEALRAAVGRMYPRLLDNPDYTSIINGRHLARLQGYRDAAAAAGTEVIELNPANESFRGSPARKLPPTLVINPADDQPIMREEIFGPLLPIRTYRDIDEVIDYINGRDHPLALYYFGRRGGPELERVIARTQSGGVTVNDIAAHSGCEDLPFGGVGPSGMGAYHGYEGFKRFSHARAVYVQSRINLTDLFGMRPPFGKRYRSVIDRMMK
ncbi:MAG: Coniferyl aldehyde dehydrogenase [Steroidobacteraceae bacterium]|nr:Coniferyl aldehyde dehydrogenase [Steroidobacteraceae bacterium]